MAFEDLTGRVETNYSINRSTGHRTGIIQTPVAGPKGTPCKFIRVHAPIEVEIITWTATAERGPPTIPSPYGQEMTTGLNANLVFLDSSIGVPVIVPIGGGNEGHVWMVSGIYTYGAVKAGPVVRNYRLGKYPFDDGVTKTQNYIPASSFSTGILDPTLSSTDVLQNPIEVRPPGKFP